MLRNLIFKTVIFLLLVCSYSFLNAQCLTSTWQKPLPQGSTLTSIYFTDDETGYVCGDNGTIIKTYDGGQSWNNLYSGTNYTLKSIFFADHETGYATGALGTMLKTINGGNTWTPLNIGQPYVDFYSVYFTSPLVGYAVGNNASYCKMIKTTDGGTTWTEIPITQASELYCVYFTSADTGYVLGYKETGTPGGSAFMKTTDAGSTWTVSYTNLNQQYYSMYFTSANTGFITGGDVFDNNGYIRKTTNAGGTWTLLTTITNVTFTSVYFSSSTTGYVAGYKYGTNTIYKTTNGGSSWTALNQGVKDYFAIWFTSLNEGIAVGRGVSRTVNAGTNWSEITYNAWEYNNSVSFANDTIGYVVGNGGILYKTTDGGQNWISKPSGTTNKLNAVLFLNPDTGFYAGASNTLCKTVDGGDNWTVLTTGVTVNLNVIFFLNNDTGYVGGDDGKILRTFDGGVTWSTINSNTLYKIYGIFFFDANNGHAVGSSGRVLNTVNGGTNWSSPPSFSGYSFYGVNFPTVSKGYLVGDYGTFYTTDNGGTSWTSISCPAYYLSSVIFTSQNTGYVCGGTHSFWFHEFDNITAMYKTTDGGTTWTSFPPISANILRSMSLVNSNTIIAVGTNGTIIKFRDEAVIDIPVADDVSQCGHGPVLLTAGNTTWCNWYSSPTDTNILCTAPVYCIPFLAQADTFYVSNTNNICESSRVPVAVSINEIPDVDLGSDIFVCDSASVSLDAPAGFDAYLWSTGSTAQSVLIDTTGSGTGIIEIILEVTDSICSNTDTINITFEDCTIVPSNTSNKLQIYPNPTKGKLFVKTDDILSVSVENENGEKIRVLKNSDEINLSGEPAGIYFIKIITTKGTCTEKIVKQ